MVPFPPKYICATAISQEGSYACSLLGSMPFIVLYFKGAGILGLGYITQFITHSVSVGLCEENELAPFNVSQSNTKLAL